MIKSLIEKYGIERLRHCLYSKTNQGEILLADRLFEDLYGIEIETYALKAEIRHALYQEEET